MRTRWPLGKSRAQMGWLHSGWSVALGRDRMGQGRRQRREGRWSAERVRGERAWEGGEGTHAVETWITPGGDACARLAADLGGQVRGWAGSLVQWREIDGESNTAIPPPPPPPPSSFYPARLLRRCTPASPGSSPPSAGLEVDEIFNGRDRG